MSEAKTVLSEFLEMCQTRCAFRLKSGRPVEGYLDTIEGDFLKVFEGGPFAGDEQVLIPLEDVDLDSLSFFDEERRCYREAHWLGPTQGWWLNPS